MEKMKLSNRETRDILIGCVVSFLIVPVLGPFMYWFIRRANEIHRRQLALLHQLSDRIRENNELASQLAQTMTSIKIIRDDISAHEQAN